jgi:hypothetical protein
MGVLNRIPVVVTARQPFVDWINGFPKYDGRVSREEVSREKDVFLMYDSEDQENYEFHLLDIMDYIFEFELNEWSTDSGTWPRDRSEKVFREWFNVEMMGLAIDPYDDIIEDEDWESDLDEDGYFRDDGDDEIR